MLLLWTKTSKSSQLFEQENTVFINRSTQSNPTSTFGFAMMLPLSRCSFLFHLLLKFIYRLTHSSHVSAFSSTNRFMVYVTIPIIKYLICLHCSPILIDFFSSKSGISKSELCMILPLSFLCPRKTWCFIKAIYQGRDSTPRTSQETFLTLGLLLAGIFFLLTIISIFIKS